MYLYVCIVLCESMCVCVTGKHTECHTLGYTEVREAWTFPQGVLILCASAACVLCVRPSAPLMIQI